MTEKFKIIKGDLVEETLVYMFSSYSKFKFSFLSLFVYLFKSCPSQFLSHWKSAELVFCSEELSILLCKNQNKSLALSYSVRKFKFAVSWEIYINISSTWQPLPENCVMADSR